MGPGGRFDSIRCQSSPVPHLRRPSPRAGAPASVDPTRESCLVLVQRELGAGAGIEREPGVVLVEREPGAVLVEGEPGVVLIERELRPILIEREPARGQ